MHSRPLQVVAHGAHAAQFFAAARAAGAAVLQLRQGRAMARRIDGRHAFKHVHAAMRGRHVRYHARGDFRIARHQGAHQAALAARGQGQRLVDILVAHHGADGAKRFHVMHGVVAEGVAAQQQGRREEAAILCPVTQGTETVGRAKHHLVTLRQGSDPFGHVILLFF